jgi:hypothetical protein
MSYPNISLHPTQTKYYRAVHRMPQEATKELEAAEISWHAAFPNPKTIAGTVSRYEVLQCLQQGKSDFIPIDLRRTDLELSSTSIF